MVSRFTTAMVALVVALVLAGVPAAWACKSAGQFKHVGVVTAVDAKALTLTIKDAQDKDYKVTTQARIVMQEPLNFVQ